MKICCQMYHKTEPGSFLIVKSESFIQNDKITYRKMR